VGASRRLTPEKVSELRKRVLRGEKKAGLARAFGISRATLNSYLRGPEGLRAGRRPHFTERGKPTVGGSGGASSRRGVHSRTRLRMCLLAYGTTLTVLEWSMLTGEWSNVS
jgi:hypothetical protein